MVHSMMSRASLPISLWGYAIMTAAHILNHVPTIKVFKTPHKMWTWKVPSLAHIKVWGYEALVRKKTHPRAKECIFISYPQKSFGLFYRPSENVAILAQIRFFCERDRIQR